MLKRILVPLDPSSHALAALDFGIVVAKRHDAEVTGFMVLDTPEIERAVGPVRPGALEYARKAERRREAKAHQRIEELLSRFVKRCEAAGVRHRSTEATGNPAEMIVRESIFYDLVLLGMRTHFHFATQDEPCNTLEEIAGRVMPPIITVPAKHPGPDAISRIVIAFGGSRTGAKSVRQFAGLPLFTNAKVTILSSNQDMEKAKRYTGAVKRFLEAHNYANVEEAWTPEPINEALREKYIGNVDLIVLGAHAKSGILSFLYGQVTKSLIADGSTPLFIAN
jgi:nucleotide-binding universal stress UspA family protein